MPEHREPYAFNHNKSKYYLDEDLADLAQAQTDITDINTLLQGLVKKVSYQFSISKYSAGGSPYNVLDVDIRQQGYTPICIAGYELELPNNVSQSAWEYNLVNSPITSMRITSIDRLMIEVGHEGNLGNYATDIYVTIVYVKNSII